ncbi:unnamed protein product, partial [Rotaria sp. Silwood2]
ILMSLIDNTTDVDELEIYLRKRIEATFKANDYKPGVEDCKRLKAFIKDVDKDKKKSF